MKKGLLIGLLLALTNCVLADEAINMADYCKQIDEGY